jgi:hypothetical protein
MKKCYPAILTLAFLLATISSNGQRIGSTAFKTQIVILKKVDYTDGPSIHLSKNEITLVDSLLQKCIEVNNADWFKEQDEYINELSTYNRQYYGYMKDSCRMVSVMCFCGNVKDHPGWKKKFVRIPFDSDNHCYWWVNLNLTKRSFRSRLEEGTL